MNCTHLNLSFFVRSKLQQCINKYTYVWIKPENVALGFLCFFLGGGLVPLGFVGTYGARSHNKFCLTVYVAAVVIIVFFLWAIGSGVSGLGDLDQKFTEPIQRGRYSYIYICVCIYYAYAASS